ADCPKLATSLAPAPKPIISTAVTTTKKTPPNSAVPRIARGMSLVGRAASSPSVDAASKPAKDRNPNTTPRNTAEVLVPGGTVNTLSVKCWPAGACPDTSRTSTTAVTSRINATVAPSTVSSTFVPRRAGVTVSSQASTSATAVRMNGAQVGGFGHTPTDCRNLVPKMPTTEDVVTP